MVLIATALLASGCGDSSANSGEVTVETGSLSKAEFIKRADGICAVMRAQFDREYAAFVQKVGAPGAKAEEAALGEAVQNLVVPTFGEEGMVGKIAILGAPGAYADEVSTALTALQVRVDEIEEEPKKLTVTAFPFKRPAKLAQEAGLTGCADAIN